MGNSKLLFNKKSLVVDPDLAVLIGLSESMILQQMHYWLQINEEAKRNLYDGYFWTFNSYIDWQKQFPFFSVKTIQRAINNLESLKLVISSNYNKMKIDRTKWYRIDYDALETLSNSPFGQIGPSNRTEWLNHLDNLTKAVPEITTEITTKINKEINKGISKENSMSFKTFTKKNPEAISSNDVNLAIMYYLASYKSYTGKIHPNLKESQWESVTGKILYVKGEYNHEKYMELDELEKIVDKHFVTEYENCDWNILHFVHGDIIKNRFYEECEF